MDQMEGISMIGSNRLVGSSFMLWMILTTVSCNQGTEPAGEVVRPVRYLQIEAASDVVEQSFAGISQAGLESRLSFKVSGQIKLLPVKVGQRVSKGQLIARLDPTDHLFKVKRAEADLAQAKIEARNTKTNYGRIRALYERNNASRNELDSARAAAESSRAAVSSATKQLEFARIQFDYTHIYAPEDCVIAATYIKKNENVDIGTPVALINCGKEPEVRIAMPENSIAKVSVGDGVEVRFDALPGQTFDAVVTEVGVAPTRTATTFPVIVKLATANERIRSGMATSVTFRFRRGVLNRRVYLVPPHAVIEDTAGRYVYIVEEFTQGLGAIKRRSVEVQDLTELGMEIVSGLTEGDRVVTAGVSKILDGQKVRIPNNPSAL